MTTKFADIWTDNIPSMEGESVSSLPIGQSLAAFAKKTVDASKTLLGDRFLCVGGGAAMIGPSGVGKSSASVQQDILWSLGCEAFGIKPARPLRILTVQAENDEGDLIEMSSGVLSTLGLDPESMHIVEENTLYVQEQTRVGAELINEVIAPLCEDFRPDLVRIDPLMAYCGCDPNDAEGMARFLRTGLNPILRRHNCAVIVNHHTPKANNRDTSKWRPSDWMYAGFGSSDFTNWARAILVIDSTSDSRVYKFIAAKRGGRIGWRDRDNNPQFERFFAHSRKHGEINWREATDEEVAEGYQTVSGKRTAKLVPTREQFLGLLPHLLPNNPSGSVLSNDQVIMHFKRNSWDKDALAGLRDDLVAEGCVQVVVCAHNKKFVGRPECATAFDRWRKTQGTILETAPLRPTR